MTAVDALQTACRLLPWPLALFVRFSRRRADRAAIARNAAALLCPHGVKKSRACLACDPWLKGGAVARGGDVVLTDTHGVIGGSGGSGGSGGAGGGAYGTSGAGGTLPRALAYLALEGGDALVIVVPGIERGQHVELRLWTNADFPGFAEEILVNGKAGYSYRHAMHAPASCVQCLVVIPYNEPRSFVLPDTRGIDRIEIRVNGETKIDARPAQLRLLRRLQLVEGT